MRSVVIAAEENGRPIGDFNVASQVAEWIDLLAVIIIAAAAAASAAVGAVSERRRTDWPTSFQTFKKYMAGGP